MKRKLRHLPATKLTARFLPREVKSNSPSDVLMIHPDPDVSLIFEGLSSGHASGVSMATVQEQLEVSLCRESMGAEFSAAQCRKRVVS